MTKQGYFTVQKTRFEKGQTFSKEAMNELFANVSVFIVEAVSEAWVEREEPPTHLEVDVKVTVA